MEIFMILYKNVYRQGFSKFYMHQFKNHYWQLCSQFTATKLLSSILEENTLFPGNFMRELCSETFKIKFEENKLNEENLELIVKLNIGDTPTCQLCKARISGFQMSLTTFCTWLYFSALISFSIIFNHIWWVVYLKSWIGWKSWLS